MVTRARGVSFATVLYLTPKQNKKLQEYGLVYKMVKTDWFKITNVKPKTLSNDARVRQLVRENKRLREKIKGSPE